MKTKTYVLTLSTHFPKGHPREGEETGFAGKMRGGIHYGPRLGDDNSRLLFKLHTIRADYDLWRHRIDEVKAGRAVLSVRQWLGAPRRSKQGEIFRFGKDSGIGVEKIDLFLYEDCIVTSQFPDGQSSRAFRPSEIANNDGLSEKDWIDWFMDSRYDLSEPMAIIHFTKFRYCK